MSLIRTEMNSEEDFKQMSRVGYENEIEDVNYYLDNMESYIKSKMDIMIKMRNNLEQIRRESKNAENLTMKLRYEQQQEASSQQMFVGNMRTPAAKLHVHSNPNGLNFPNFNGFNNFPDEQLLEGLPDDSMSRLF